LDVLGVVVSSTIWKVNLAVWPMTFFSRSGSLSPARLDDDPVLTLAGDVRLLGAHLVDAAPDDLDGLLHGPRRLGLEGCGHEGDAQALIGAGADSDVAATSGPGQRRADGPAKEVGGVRHLARIGDPHADRVAHDREVCEGDFVLAQRRANVLDEVGQPLGAQRLGVDRIEQVGTALQVETEVQRLLGHEGRKLIAHVGRQHIRQREQHAEQRRQSDEDHLPAGKGHHGW
jgi:hypothetical protein